MEEKKEKRREEDKGEQRTQSGEVVAGQIPSAIEEDEIDLFELWEIIWRRKKIIFALTFFITALTAVFSLLMTPIYKATVKIMPLSSGGGFMLPIPTEALQFLGISGLGGGSQNIIQAVLTSRELAKRVIEKTGIKKYLYGELWDEEKGRVRDDIPPDKIPTLDELASSFVKNYLKVSEDRKTGVIEVSVLFPKEPTLAAYIANEYVKELQNLLNERSYTLAKKNRIFLEERINLVKEELERAEKEFKEFQERYNVVAIDKQMEEGLRLYAQLIGALSEKEMRLEVLRKLTTPDNPEVLTLRYEIDELRKKIKELEEGQSRGELRGYIVDKDKKLLIPLESVPDVALEYIRKRRNLEIQNEIYKVLLKALEQAKIEEAKEEVSFEVIDWAYPPKARYKPKRKLMVAVAFVSSLFLGVFLVFVIEAVEKRKKERQKEDEKSG